MLDFNWPNTDEFPLDIERIRLWLNDVCLSENKTLTEVAVVFMSDEDLLEMNAKFLNHDFYTDIITFDYCVDMEVSGDLFVSVDRVVENARVVGVSFLEELNRVLVHGVLHLCGYGDKGEEEEKLMRKKEDFYLNKLKGFT